MEKIQVGILTTKAGGLECTGVVRWYDDKGLSNASDFIVQNIQTIIFNTEVPSEVLKSVKETVTSLVEE